MKIKETIERECCQPIDLEPYRGRGSQELSRFNPRFCIHCGQLWFTDRQMDPAGSMEDVDRPFKPDVLSC